MNATNSILTTGKPGAVTFSELPESHQGAVRKVYFERSPYASIEVLTNGKARVHNHVTCCFIACESYADANGTRLLLSQYYAAAERAFR